jgi:hypothetical protein
VNSRLTQRIERTRTRNSKFRNVVEYLVRVRAADAQPVRRLKRMSWVIEIADGNFPADTDAAWELLEQLRYKEEQREFGSPPSPRMESLYRELTARYPCITENPESPWSDGPLINDFGDRLAAVGFISSGMNEAFPFVIAKATEMGFTVFDGGDDAIHRPKGWQAPGPDIIDEKFRLKPWWKFW